MHISRQILFESTMLRVGGICVRPTSEGPGELEAASVNILALPVAGLFAYHDTPRRCTLATPNDALFISANRPYRLSFPGGWGDDCITLQFGAEALAAAMPESMKGDGFDIAKVAPAALLSPAAALSRGLLRQALWPAGKTVAQHDALAVEERCLMLLGNALQSARREQPRSVRARPAVAQRGVARALEAVAATPQAKWSLEELAGIANMSAFHLAHTFRAEVGTPVYRYVLRARLAMALERVLSGDDDLSAVAQDCGFASHSHFTARFREHFGVTPVALRASGATQLRKIAIA